MDNTINICHISDLHFGLYYNRINNSCSDKYSLTDSFINYISDLKDKEKPHFVIISGDITSLANKDEFKDFNNFISSLVEQNCISECIFNKYSRKDRIIVVPGNHDVVRKLKIKGKYGRDKGMEKFKEHVTKKGVNTPFGNRNKYCFEVNKKHRCPIPCALYFYPEYNLLFCLLVSCYFSHFFKPKVEKIYKKYSTILSKRKKAEFEKDISEIIYNDYGEFPGNYILKIKTMLNKFEKKNNFSQDAYNKIIKFAITHHQITSLDSQHIFTKKADVLRRSLGKRGIISVLHGHIHNTLQEKYIYEKWTEDSLSLSSGSLSGYCRSAINKFNMIEIKNFQDFKDLSMKVTCYEANQNGYYFECESKELYPNSINSFLNSMKESYLYNGKT